MAFRKVIQGVTIVPLVARGLTYYSIGVLIANWLLGWLS